MKHPLRLVALAGLVALLTAACADGTPVKSVETVRHGPVPSPTYIDQGDAGPSAGDLRVFQLQGTAEDDSVVQLDVLMTTISSNTPDAGLERRVTQIVFTFADPDDQVILEGSARYPTEGSTVDVGQTAVRPIIGGSGKYRFANGWAESTQVADGSWTHVLHIAP
ncbi:MAG TPA: hypothetical protein VFY23_01535 [Candidatus Limnocylindrales bacterium]|nr:hypothetical protein [Candidatus Limnocylindrales bacterium]